jgi:hypothetical protein
MNIIMKLLILVIIFITGYVVYGLFQKNADIKKQMEQEIEQNENHSLEEFSNLTAAKDVSKLNDEASALGVGLNIQSVPEGHYNFPIKEFVIKSSYNSAIVGGSASKEAIKFVLKRGCRVLDFEIYTRRDDKDFEREYISYSEDPQYKSINTDLDLSMEDAFTTVIGNAFASESSVPAPKDPLFVHLRIKNHSRDAYKRIVKSLETNFGSKLYDKKVNGSTRIGDLMDKIVVILDTTSAPDYDNYGSCLKSDGTDCVPFSVYIQLRSGMVDFPKYSYIDYGSSCMISSPISISDDGRTDMKSFYMVTPPQVGNVEAPTVAELAKQPCQMVLMKFYNQTPALKSYEKIFNNCESSFCLISSLIKNSRRSNNSE